LGSRLAIQVFPIFFNETPTVFVDFYLQVEAITMVKVDILLKEMDNHQLVVSVEPNMETATDLEKHAALIFKRHVDNALAEYQKTCAKFVLDLEGEEATEWKRKIFGD
jgi:deoxyxylulose-5-phosphate synthase